MHAKLTLGNLTFAGAVAPTRFVYFRGRNHNGAEFTGAARVVLKR